MPTIPSDEGIDVYPVDYASELLWNLITEVHPAMKLMSATYKPMIGKVVQHAASKGVYLVQAQDDENIRVLAENLSRGKITFNLAKRTAPEGEAPK